MKLATFFLIIVTFLCFQITPIALAQDKVGVGVGTGKIVVEEEFKPGASYTLPLITVINTGNINTRYTLDFAYHEQQSELRPEKNWFSFSPDNFLLDPQQAQPVSVQLTLPLKSKPGDYFVYIEARPVIEEVEGDSTTSVGVAAATKVYFKIKPANFIQAIGYRFESWYLSHPRLMKGIGITLALYFGIKVTKRFINFDISLKTNNRRRRPPKYEQ